MPEPFIGLRARQARGATGGARERGAAERSPTAVQGDLRSPRGPGTPRAGLRPGAPDERRRPARRGPCERRQGRAGYIRAIIAWPKPEHDTCVAPSISRAKS
ncbi:MAG: hypothetical protein BroJett026_37560 [Betaproteobacteria bacterium]|nr:MAG: hypothetical protein BroJett026_37560 [Betaproteobacteria bacterium]